ncbi:MAG: hypothetical protein IPG33_02895 [Betaproteobacteria bacterium]|nr:hypothetical protein [Betaproteobacteria bacterium]
MANRNSTLIDSDRGLFSILRLVKLRLPGPYLWQGEDIDNEKAMGSAFHAFVPEDSNVEKTSVASIIVADVTNDTSEPDVSNHVQVDTTIIDKYLRTEVLEQSSLAGEEIADWTPSRLHKLESGAPTFLLTEYTLRGNSKEMRHIDLRINAGGRKIVAKGICYDMERAEELSQLVFSVLGSIVISDSRKADVIAPISSTESPREILAADFKSLQGGLPISGGWGYSRDDACIINKNDPLVNPKKPFNGVAIEYVFVEKRIYEEMITFRSDGEKFSGISWKLQEQSTLHEEGKVFDRLVYEITAFSDSDWEELKAEFEGPQGYSHCDFDIKAHEEKRQQKMLRLTREFWFDITSFFGQGLS